MPTRQQLKWENASSCGGLDIRNQERLRTFALLWRERGGWRIFLHAQQLAPDSQFQH
jgi:hypothetical protein